MKIKKIEVIPVGVPRARELALATYGKLGVGNLNFLLVKLHTDTGLVGLGEVPPLPPLSPESQPVISVMIKEWLAPQVLGEDPFDYERIRSKMDFVASHYPMSISPIDQAIWDLMSKSLNIPLHKMLGCASPKPFPIVGLIGIGTKNEICQDAKKFIDKGFTGLRLKIAKRRDTENVKALRDYVGDDVTIRVDCNQSYSPDEAVKMIRSIEGFDVELVEQPTIWWDFKAVASVATRVDTPIMPHESIFKVSDVKALYDLGALGVLGLKTYRPIGGVTGAVRLLDWAKLSGVPCLFHDDLELGVSLAFASHIIAARIGDIKYTSELSGYPEWIKDEVIVDPIQVVNGKIVVPEGPGIGVELDESKIAKYSKGPFVCE